MRSSEKAITRHGTVEKGHDRGVVSIFGAVRATRLA